MKGRGCYDPRGQENIGVLARGQNGDDGRREREGVRFPCSIGEVEEE